MKRRLIAMLLALALLCALVPAAALPASAESMHDPTVSSEGISANFEINEQTASSANTNLRTRPEPTYCPTEPGHTHTWGLSVLAVEPTCTEPGYWTTKCSGCGTVVVDEVEPKGHNYVNGICSRCGEKVAGKAFALSNNLKDGDQVILYNPSSRSAITYYSAETNSCGGTPVTVSNNAIYNAPANIIWTVKRTSKGYQFLSENGNKLSFGNNVNHWHLIFDESYDTWELKTSSSSLNCVYIRCVERADGFWRYMDWFDKFSWFSTYRLEASDADAKTFDFQIFSASTPVPPTTGYEYALTSSLKNGDEVVIFNPGHGMAIKNENDNNWYLTPQEIMPIGNKIFEPDASLVWTVVDNGDGTFSFKNGYDKIVCWVSGSYFELTNDANYAGADGKWKVRWTDGLAYIQHATFSNSYGPAYIECYYNASKDKTNISAYSSSNPAARSNDFGFQFFVKTGNVVTVTPSDIPTEPADGSFVLSSPIKGGDKVVIYNPGHGVAIKDENDKNWYLVPQEITPTGNKIYEPDASLVWTVVDNGDGTFSFTNGSDAIVCWVSGSYFELTNDPTYDGSAGKWVINWIDGLAYIQHATFSNSYGPAYIECYYNASKDKTNISAYSSSNPAAKSADYGFQFFVQHGSVAPTEPTTAPTELDRYLRFSDYGNLYAFIGDSSLYDMSSEDAPLIGYFSATFDKDKLSAEDIVWSTSDESILRIVSAEAGYKTVYLGVEAIAEGDVTLTATVQGIGAKSAQVHVTKPNNAVIQALCEKEYYYSDGVFIGQTNDFSTTPEVYVSVQNHIKNDYLKVAPSDNNALHNVTFRATISGKDFSLSPTGYSNTYSCTYETVSLGKLADDLIMLYPYEFNGKQIDAGKKYTITVQISGDEIETSTNDFYFHIKDFASPTIEQHVNFIKNNGTYRAYRVADYPGEMMALTSDVEYIWDYATCEFFGETFKISNPYEIVVADVVAELAQSKTLEHWRIKLLSNEWKSLYDSLKDGIDTIVQDNYDEMFFKYDSKEGITASVTKLFQKSKYSGNAPVEGDELYETILDVFGSEKNVGKINGIFKAADKTSQGIKLIKSGLGVINSIRDTINYYNALNAYASMDQNIKKVIRLVAEDTKSSNKALYDALDRYVKTETDASGYALSLADVTIEGIYRSGYNLLNTQYGSAVKSLIWSYVGKITLTNGKELSAVTIGGTSLLTYIGSVTVGIGLGLAIGDFLTNGNSVSSEMRKVVITGVLSKHTNNVLTRIENKVVNLQTQEASDSFEAAFALYKAVENYSRAHTIKAVKAKNESIIGKLVQIFKHQDCSATIAELQDQIVTLDQLQCHSDNQTDTISEWSKIVQVKCPVDVFLYNTEGDLLVSIEADAVTYADRDVSALVIGSEKYIVLPATTDYSIKIVATDDGTMNYSVIERNGLEDAQRVNFYDIPLESGQEFTGMVPSESMAAAKEYSLQTEIDNESVIISANEEIIGTEQITVSVEAIGNGIATKVYYVSKGDFVTLTAAPAEGETFEGWYREDSLVSTETEYRFCPSEDCSFTARFTNHANHVHQYEATVVAPTCTKQGYTLHACACGDSYIDTYVDALGHDFVNGVCTRCGEIDPGFAQTEVPGDVNGDGDVDTVDAIRLARFLVDLVELTDAQIKAADVTGDDDVTTTDAIRLARYLVGLVETLRPEPAKAEARARSGIPASRDSR